FQAEDGIRDRTVTGVQTCALPISREAILTGVAAHERPVRQLAAHRFHGAGPAVACRVSVGEEDAEEQARIELVGVCMPDVASLRSEERRVGRECRSAWAQYEEKKK